MIGPEQIKQLKLWIQPKITTFIITNEYLLFIVYSQNENYTTETFSKTQGCAVLLHCTVRVLATEL